jgi:hypothetical protein
MHSNQLGLAARGYAYYSTPNRSDARGLAAAALDFTSFDDFLRNSAIESIEEREAFRRSVVEDLATFFARLPTSVHTVVVSSEHLHSRLRTADQVHWLVESIEQYATQVQALVYLRPQIDLACSYYSTALKTGTCVDLQTFVTKGCTASNHYYNYARFLKLWSSRIGSGNLCVRKFERPHFCEGDLLSDFCDAIGLADNEIRSLKRPEKLNESLTLLGQRLLRILNINRQKVPDLTAETSDEIQQLTGLVIRQFAGTGELMQESLATVLQSTFDEVNEEVRSTFFAESDALFSNIRVAPDEQEVLLVLSDSQLITLEQVFEIAKEGNDATALELIDQIAVQLRDYGLKIADEKPRHALDVLKVAQRIRPTGFRIRRGIEALEASISQRKIGWFAFARLMRNCRAKFAAWFR